MTAAAERRKILVTGGLGFIGFHLAVRLSREPGTELVIVDNLMRGRLDADARALVARANVRFVEGDLTDPGCYPTLGQGFAEVYHCAAVIGVRQVIERPEVVLRVNALSVILLLEWFVAGGAERLVFPSTSEAYAWTQTFHDVPVPTPEEVPLAVTDLENPRASYAASKIFGEVAVTQYCRRYRKRFAIVRYHNVYGPRMGTDHVIPELYRRAVVERQNPLVVYATDHSRAFCYVDDAVDATIAAMRVPGAAGRTFNIGNDRMEITIGALAQALLAAAGVEASIEARPAPNDPITRRCPDLTKARQILGCEPTIALDCGLRRTLAWYEPFFREHA